MKNLGTIVLAILLLITQQSQARQAVTVIDSSRYPSSWDLELIGGFQRRSIYPSTFIKTGLRYDFPRKTVVGLATGAYIISSDGVGGLTIPVLMVLSTPGKRSGIKISLGVLANLGPGQPFFFPNMDFRLRLVGKKGGFVDLLLSTHYKYSYDCRRSNVTCQGPLYRSGWGGSPGLGLAFGRLNSGPKVLKKN